MGIETIIQNMSFAGNTYGIKDVKGTKEAKESKNTADTKISKEADSVHLSATEKKVNVKGKTIGQPKLSEKAAKYYEELKSKYQNMDFILVSKDMKEMAQANAGSFANPQKMVVLIDEEKIERMAEDEKYRKQYENVIASAQTKLPQLKQALGAFSGVKGFGVQVKDNGVTSFFAVMSKSFNDQAARLEKRRVEKKAEKKEAEKKAEKKERQERLEEKREEHRLETKKAEEEVFSADSIEELVKLVEDFNYQFVSDTTMTEAEKGLGTVIDFKG